MHLLLLSTLAVVATDCGLHWSDISLSSLKLPGVMGEYNGCTPRLGLLSLPVLLPVLGNNSLHFGSSTVLTGVLSLLLVGSLGRLLSACVGEGGVGAPSGVSAATSTGVGSLSGVLVADPAGVAGLDLALAHQAAPHQQNLAEQIQPEVLLPHEEEYSPLAGH